MNDRLFRDVYRAIDTSTKSVVALKQVRVERDSWGVRRLLCVCVCVDAPALTFFRWGDTVPDDRFA